MSYAPQSSPPRCRQPAWAALIITLLAAPAAGQAQVRLTQDARITKAPGAQSLGTLLSGASVTPGRSQGNAVEVQFEGWLPTGSLGATQRDSFDVVVRKRPNETLRSTPSGAALGRVSLNVGFLRVETRGDWTRVRRTAWIDQRAIPAGQGVAAGGSPGGPDRAEVMRKVPLAAAPGGAVIGSADSGAAARVLARSGGWTRVQLEAWVPDSALHSTDSRVLVGLSQAEVRANPAKYVGQLVEWRVQFVAIQKADELRPEIPLGQSYLLTRGPLPEPGFVYVVIPSASVARFQAIPVLKELTLRGTIRAATTKYLPTPVLDLVDVVDGLGQ